MAIGASGKEYSKDAAGNITIKRPDGTTSTVKATDAAYKSTVNAMHQDGAKNIGVSSGTQTPAPVQQQNNVPIYQVPQQNVDFAQMFKDAMGSSYDARQSQNDYYQQAMEQARQANKQQVDASVAGMQANEGKINQGYEDLARQAFVQAKVGQNSLTENLAINGINGGATESAVLGIENQYQQSLAGIGQDKQNALNQLQTDIAQVKASGNAQLAQTMSDYYMKLADASIAADNENYNRLMNSLNMAMQQAQLTGQFNGSPTMQAQQLAYEQAMKQNMYNDDKANAEYEKQQRAYINAVNEIQSFGKVISPSLIQALGGQSIADQMAKSYLQQQMGPMTTGSSGGSTQKKSSSGSYSSGSGGAALKANPSPKNDPVTPQQTGGYKPTDKVGLTGKFSAPVGWNLNIKAAIEQYNSGKITYGELQKKLQAYGYSSAQLS